MRKRQKEKCMEIDTKENIYKPPFLPPDFILLQ